MHRAYDVGGDETVSVPETRTTHVEFCDLARLAWATIRARLDLPAAEPEFVWCDRGGQGLGDAVLGDTVMVGNRPVCLDRRCDRLILPGEPPTLAIESVAEIVAGFVPIAVFGRMRLPVGVYYAVRLQSGQDSFSLRVLHDYVVRLGDWVSRIDVLFAREVER